MLSIRKRVAGVGAAVALITAAAPAALAGAATVPGPTPLGPVAGAYAAGTAAAIGGWNAGAAAAVGGWNAGAAALGLPFQFTVTPGPFGVHGAGVAPLLPPH
jgi:hypothetical protein